MYSLFISAYFLVWAVCDFFHINRFKAMLWALPAEKEARVKYRKLRGIGFLGLAMVAGYVFMAEMVFGVRYTWVEALYYIAFPYAVPLLYIVILGVLYKVYRFPWTSRNGETADQE